LRDSASSDGRPDAAILYDCGGEPEERSAAAGITGVARTTGAAISPLFVGFLFARPALINVPFYIAGALKIVYDLLLYKEFISTKPPEEQRLETFLGGMFPAFARSGQRL